MMGRKKELVKNTAIIGIGQLCTKFLSFLLLPIYTAYLSPEEYGTFDLYSTIRMLVVSIAFIQLEQGVFRLLLDKRADKEGTSRIITTSLSVAVVSAVLVSLLSILLSFLMNYQYAYYLLFSIIAVALSGVLLQISRGMGNTIAYSIGAFISGGLQVILNIVFIVFMNMGVPGMFCSVIFGNFACCIFLFVRLCLWKFIEPNSISMNTGKELMKYSIPLIPNSLSWWLVSGATSIIVVYFLGMGANGIVGIANKFASIMAICSSIYLMSWSETVSLHLYDDDRESFFSNMIDVALCLFFALFLLTLMVLSVAFPYVINERYDEAFYILPLFLVAMMLSVIQVLYGAFYIAMKNTVQLAKSTLFAGIVSIVTHLILIKFIGIYASGVSSVLAYAVVALYRVKDMHKYMRIRLSSRRLALMLSVSVVVIGCYYLNNVVICAIIYLIACAILTYLNKPILINIGHYMKKVMKR